MSEATRVSVAGALSDHRSARAFATEVHRVHHRYATEVVGAFSLCPHMKDPDTAFGSFCVVLDREPALDDAVAQVVGAGASVLHLVYPLVEMGVVGWERFGSQLHNALAVALEGALVHASFHPEMEGDGSTASRLVGMLRRAPDPFVQFIPEGLHVGGTQFADPSTFDFAAMTSKVVDSAQSNHDRLSAEQLDVITARQNDIKDDRKRSYAGFLREFGFLQESADASA
jgi:hypothetical protein